MQTAEVTFARNDGVIEMALHVGGKLVATSGSEESIARELQMRGIRYLGIDGLFSTDLPTSKRTLAEASEVAFKELMPALKLIAACSSMGEVAVFPFPERRAKPRLVRRSGEDV